MPTEVDDILTIIQTSVEGPQEVSSDAGTVRQFSPSELIAAHKYLSSIPPAVPARTSGLRFARLVPGGPVQRDDRG